METKIFKDSRLKSIQWKDLLVLTPREIFYELTLSLPWLIASLFFAYFKLLVPALFCSFLFFLTGLRQVHNAYHYALGISNENTDRFIWVLSVLMLSSMHAVKYNHLQHHKHCLEDADIEGMSARMVWWKVLLFGPVFPFLLHVNAIKNSEWKIKKWIIVELISIGLITLVVFARTDIYILKYHFLVMLVGEAMTAFFAVWTVHHHTDDQELPGRTIRGKFKSLISYNMFYHAEHHMFPKVPTCHLPQLAERLDKTFPEVNKAHVF
jgi:fatty acid desaturase